MYFYLPEENINVNRLLTYPDVFSAIREDENDNNVLYDRVVMSIPKFKVSDKTDLVDTLNKLGVTDVLDPYISDCTPLTSDYDLIYLDSAEHAAILEINEEGIIGAGYTLEIC